METKKFLKFLNKNERKVREKSIKEIKKINKTLSWKITQKLYIVVGWEMFVFFQKQMNIKVLKTP